MERSASGELDTMPGKRKAPGPSSRAPLRTSPAEAGTARALAPAASGCAPAMSSPAIGAWGLHGSGECRAEPGCDSCLCDTAGSLRGGKAFRVCSDAAVAAAAAAGPPGSPVGSPAAGEARPLSYLGASGTALGPCSLPPGMYRSFHLGCCSRLSSSSSLADLDAAAAAAVPGSGGEEADPATAGAAGVACTTAAADEAAAAASAERGSCPEAAAGAADVTAAGLAAAAASRPQQPSWPPPSPVCGAAQRGQLAWHGRDGGKDSEAASCWHDIPDDLLRRVLDRLQPSSLRVLRLVCRGWEAAASRLLRHMRPETVAGKQLSRRFPCLHSLDLSNALMGVDFASPRQLRLQSLLLDEHLAELAGLHRLEQLSLRGCSRISGLGIAQLGRLTSLACLNLSNCTGLRDECLAALAAALPQLATLNLQGCRVGDDGVAHLAALPRLRHVLLPAGVTDACMPALVGMPALERVALRGCGRVTTAGIYLLLQRRGLKRVVISKCPQVTLEALCAGDGGELGGARLVAAEAGITAQAAAAAAAGLPAGQAGMVGQDMQLLVGEP